MSYKNFIMYPVSSGGIGPGSRLTLLLAGSSFWCEEGRWNRTRVESSSSRERKREKNGARVRARGVGSWDNITGSICFGSGGDGFLIEILSHQFAGRE